MADNNETKATHDRCGHCGTSVSRAVSTCAGCGAVRMSRFDYMLSSWPLAAINWYGGALIYFLIGPFWILNALAPFDTPLTGMAGFFTNGTPGIVFGALFTLLELPLYRLVRWGIIENIFGRVWVRHR